MDQTSRPVDPRLTRERAVRRAVAASVAVGIVSTASIVVQALAIADLLSGAMGDGGRMATTTALALVAGAAGVRGFCALAGELLAAHGAIAAKESLRIRLIRASVDPALAGGDGAGIATVAGRGLDALDNYIGRCLPDMVLAGIAPVALAAAVGWMDWLSGLIVGAMILLFPVFGALVGKGTGELAGERWRQVEAFGAQIADIFAGLVVLKAFGRTRAQRERVRQAGEALRRSTMATLRVAFLSGLVLDTLASISVALVAVPLGLRLLSGSIRLPDALAVLIVAPEVFVPLRRASAEFHESAEGLAAAASALDVIDAAGQRATGAEVPARKASAGKTAVGKRPASNAPASNAPASNAPDPATVPVQLSAVTVRLPGRVLPVLERANLAIAPGETVVVLGANGAGKSTTLSLLAGLLEPSAGSLLVGGVDLRDIDPAAWRRRLAYLPHRPAVIAGTLADNLRLGDGSASDQRLIEALAAVGGEGLLSELAEGLGTVIGDGGRPVSAGERQRIGLARALVRKASLYLLDEPTVHLDRATEQTAIEGLRHHLEGRSALIVTHSPALAVVADRIVELRDATFRPVTAGDAAQLPSAGADLRKVPA